MERLELDGRKGHTVKVATLGRRPDGLAGDRFPEPGIPDPWLDPADVSRVHPGPDEDPRAAGAGDPSCAWRTPSPELCEKTIEEFKRPEIPAFVSPIPNSQDEAPGS